MVSPLSSFHKDKSLIGGMVLNANLKIYCKW